MNNFELVTHVINLKTVKVNEISNQETQTL